MTESEIHFDHFDLDHLDHLDHPLPISTMPSQPQ